VTIGEDLNSRPTRQGQRSVWATFSVVATALAAVITALATLFGVFSQGKNNPGAGIVQGPGSGPAAPPASFPIARDIACRPPMARSQDARVQAEVRNLIEATYQICVTHPDGKFDPPEGQTTVTEFVPAGDGTATYSVEGNATGYVRLRIDGPRDTIGKWSASWQQNSSGDCWGQLVVTGPDGLQREKSTYTDCHPRR
jgi:hypothetical protein